MRADITTATATIANGASTSDAVLVKYREVVGIVIPAVWTAAGVAFTVSHDGGTTYYPVKRPEVGTTNAPIPVKNLELLAADIPTGTATFIPLPSAWFLGATHIKVLSQTTGSGVNQGAERLVTVVMRQVA
jgi:hypothetical protein